MDEQHWLIQERLAKLRQLEERGGEAFPYRFARSHRLAQVTAQQDALLASSEAVRVVGRVMAVRRHGAAASPISRTRTAACRSTCAWTGWARPSSSASADRPGDWVGCEGKTMVTRTGELTVDVARWSAGQVPAPLPEKWHGLQDVEIRYRQRYLD